MLSLKRALVLISTLLFSYLHSAVPVQASQIPLDPVSADLDPNAPGLEIIQVAKGDNRLQVWHQDGTLMEGWTGVEIGGPAVFSPSVIDLNGDGTLEVIVCADDHRVYVFGPDGIPFDYDKDGISEWPKDAGSAITSTPAVQDLDEDGTYEIAVATRDGQIHGWAVDPRKMSGEELAGWPSAITADQAVFPIQAPSIEIPSLELWELTNRLIQYAPSHDSTDPSEDFTYEPKYLINLKSFFTSSSVKWNAED